MTRAMTAAAAILSILLAGGAAVAPSQAEVAPRALARNFEGVWTNATVTRLERPAAFSELVVPKDRADAADKATAARIAAANAPSDLSQGTFKDEDATAGYNNFWIDAGEGLMRVRGQARSSFITSPADGASPQVIGPTIKPV